MKKFFITIILGMISQIATAQENKETSEQIFFVDGIESEESLFSNGDQLNSFEELAIPATKRSFSLKHLGMYLKLASLYCYNDGIKPAYYAILGYIKNGRKK